MHRVLLVMPEHFSQLVAPQLRSLLPNCQVSWIPRANVYQISVDELRTAEFIVFSGFNFPRDLLAACSGTLRLLQKWGAGIDGIDLGAARELGIPVANAPGMNAVSVAEHFFALMLALYREICHASRGLSLGQWLQPDLVTQGINEVNGKELGLVGLGRIGREIAVRANAFGMRVSYYRRNRMLQDDEDSLAVTFKSLNSLVSESDVIGLALPLTDETRSLFDIRMFRTMKNTALLLNVSRGAIVDEADLHTALEQGLIAGAGMDVFEIEPPPASNPLIKLPNVVATPHIAGRSQEALRNITRVCASNIELVLRKKDPNFRVL